MRPQSHRAQSLSISIPVVDLPERPATDHRHEPVLVVPQGVYLCGEPDRATLEEFDVVINVAREVANPFEWVSSPGDTTPRHTRTLTDVGAQSQSVIAVSEHGAITSRLYGLSRSVEYVDVPWDHGSQLGPDLEPLTDFMADRVRARKRVLVHCQCGVSRSASLVVAFVMRQFGLDVDAAYQYVKARSPGISPNIGLVSQLFEWQESSGFGDRSGRESDGDTKTHGGGES